MLFRTIQRPRPGVLFAEGQAFREQVPPGRRWLLQGLIHHFDRTTNLGVDRIEIRHDDELIADIRRRMWGNETNFFAIYHYPLREILEPGDTVEIRVAEIGGLGNSTDFFYLQLWDLALDESIPEANVPTAPRRGAHGLPLDYDPTPGNPAIPLASPNERQIYEQEEPLQPEPPILEEPLEPFPVDRDDFPGNVVPRGFPTGLSEQLNIGQLPAAAREILPRIGRQLSHLVGADRFAARLVRATSGGALAVTRSHRHYTSITVKSPPVAGHDEVFRRPVYDATFQSLSGAWDVYTLNPEQHAAGVAVTDVTPIRVQHGERVALRQEIKALHADGPSNTAYIGQGFTVNGWI